MKRLILLLTIFGLLYALAYDPLIENVHAAYYATKVYISQGGDTLVVKDGGVLDVNGRADIDSASIAVATVTSLVGGTGTFSGALDVSGASSGLMNIRGATTDSTLTKANFPPGSVIYVTGISEITLPTAEAGLSYTIVTVGTDSVIVLPGSGDNIDHDGAADAANYCATGTANEVITVAAADTTSWTVLVEIGTWGTY